LILLYSSIVFNILHPFNMKRCLSLSLALFFALCLSFSPPSLSLSVTLILSVSFSLSRARALSLSLYISTTTHHVDLTAKMRQSRKVLVVHTLSAKLRIYISRAKHSEFRRARTSVCRLKPHVYNCGMAKRGPGLNPKLPIPNPQPLTPHSSPLTPNL